MASRYHLNPIMALPFQLSLSRLQPARHSSMSYPSLVLNMFPKARCWQFPPSRSRHCSASKKPKSTGYNPNFFPSESFVFLWRKKKELKNPSWPPSDVKIGVMDRTATSRPVQVRCIAQEEGKHEGSGIIKDKSVSVVLLAGGKGKRMGVSIPKQYLPLLGKPIALYSFYTFSQLSEVKEIIVVCDTSYKDVFEDACEGIGVDIKFALPGKVRQDSVFNGFQEVDQSSELVCIHDSARPLISFEDVRKVLKDGWLNGAAVLGVPVKATIKEANNDLFVVRTLNRKTLWEMQTPQVIKPDLLRAGFELVNQEGLEVTDDVSIVEHLKHPVYITEGSYTNIKVTTPDDLLLAERIINMQT